MAPAPAAAAGGMRMPMGGGSRNMKAACYKDPSKAKCKDFERSSEGGCCIGAWRRSRAAWVLYQRGGAGRAVVICVLGPLGICWLTAMALHLDEHTLP